MQRSNISAPIADHNDTIFSSIELSRKEWLVTVQSPDRDKLSRYKVAAGDHVGLLELLNWIRERAERRLGRKLAVVSCYEAGFDGFGMVLGLGGLHVLAGSAWSWRSLWQLRGCTSAAGRGWDLTTTCLIRQALRWKPQRGRRAKSDGIDGAGAAARLCERIAAASRGWCASCGCIQPPGSVRA